MAKMGTIEQVRGALEAAKDGIVRGDSDMSLRRIEWQLRHVADVLMYGGPRAEAVSLVLELIGEDEDR